MLEDYLPFGSKKAFFQGENLLLSFREGPFPSHRIQGAGTGGVEAGQPGGGRLAFQPSRLGDVLFQVDSL